MIASMDQVLVVGRRSMAKDVLTSLQNLGAVQVDTLSPDDEGQVLRRLKLEGEDLRAKEAWDRIVARAASVLDQLGEGEGERGKGDVDTDSRALEADLTNIAEQVERLVAERSDLRDELDLIETYLPLLRNLAPMVGPLEDARYLAGSAFMVAGDDLTEVEAKLKDAFGDRFTLASRPHRGERLTVAAVLRSDLASFRSALARVGLAELALPERYAGQGVAKVAHVMEERSQALPKRLSAISEELAKLSAAHGPRLRAILRVARNHQARYQRLEDLAEGRYAFALQGWVPSSETHRVVGALAKQFGDDLAIQTRVADEHHDVGVPVKFDNPAWVRPFQGLLALFAPPKYGSFDPSWTLAVFFPLFFGIVVGDMGYGLLFAALAWWMRRRGAAGKKLDLGPLNIVVPPNLLKPISTVIFWLAGWSIVFGFLFGEFFGNFLEHFPHAKPVFYTTLHHDAGYGWIPIALFRVEEFTPLLLVSIGFGVLQVLGGWLIRAIFAVKHGDRKHLFEGIGMFAGLAAVVTFAAAYLMDAVTPVVLTIAAIGFAVFLVSAVVAKMPLMLVELISNSGNILSYLRLFAVGLSAALVANLATDLGFGLSGTLPILGPIIGIVVGLSVHLIALVLTIIGHTLQPLRLQYVEFFTKFGFYDHSGRPYQPFKLVGGK